MLYTTSALWSSFWIAGLALLINLPVTYRLTSGLFNGKIGKIPLRTADGSGPTWQAVAFHALVLFIILLIAFLIISAIHSKRVKFVVLNPADQK
jgi:hypothetical protein